MRLENHVACKEDCQPSRPLSMMSNQVETFSETSLSSIFQELVAYINTLINLNTAVHREINRLFCILVSSSPLLRLDCAGPRPVID